MYDFQISGTDYNYNPDTRAEPDNIVLWSNAFGSGINFAVEWVSDSGNWGSMVGSITAGDIASQASARGVTPAAFRGIFVKAKGGDDLLHADGDGSFGIRTGAPSVSCLGGAIPYALIGQRLYVHANGGDDQLFGSPGDDVIHGGAGDDLIRGFGGNDRLVGDFGNDDILGGSGQDTILGGAGRDNLFGLSGDDHLAGQEGDDVILGGAGDDDLQGGPGNDDLVGDELWREDPVVGSDRLDGGPGDDSLLGDNSDRNPAGGSGTDTLQAGPSTLGLGSPGTLGFQVVNHDIEKIDTTGADPGEPHTQQGPRFAQPGPFSGLIELFADQTALKAMAGIPDPDEPFLPGPFGGFELNDAVYDAHASPPINGDFEAGVGPSIGDGHRASSRVTGGMILRTGEQDDWLAGSELDDQLDAGAGDDRLVSGRGRDLVMGGNGGDLVIGGPGADILIGDGPLLPETDELDAS